MHGRYRGPVNGNRSSSMGVRASPERFARGRGEYRNYSRGRGQSKQFGLPHGNEIFMEAGRLAAEYLVSKGVLHPSALAGKYQNGSLKNSVGEFQGFRSQEADFMGVPVEGRISAIPRLGSAAGDVGHGRKRFPEDYNSMSSRSFVRESRRNETARNYGSEFDRELGRVGSWNRVRNSPDVDAQDNAFSGNRAEQKVAKNSDAVLQSSPPRKIDPVIESSGDSLIDSDSAGQNKAGDDAGKKASPIRIEINLQLEDERQHTEKCIEMETSKIEVDQVAVSNDNCDLETKSAKEDIEVEPCAEEHMHTSKSTEEHTQMTKSSNNLLSVWRFEHVPKKTRSSLANRVLKVFDNAVIKDENAREMELPKDTQMHSELNHVDVSAGVISSPHSHDARNLDSGKSEPLNLEEESRSSQVIKQVNEPLDLEEESRSSQVIKQVNETDSSSLGDSMVIKEDETIVELRGFESCNSINLERGEKRALEHDDDCIGRTKKPRELVSSMCSLSDAILYHSSSMEDWSNSQEPGTSHGEGVLLSLDEKKLVDIPLVTKSDVESGTDFTGKQLFPGSLKTCDLNLLEASVVNETQNADPINIFPGITGSVKEEAPVDIDLTMSSNCNTASQYAKSAFDHIDIEVIDLDNDSEQEDKALNNPDTRSEVVFTGSDGFSNNPHGTDDTTDVQDGYGLMISELLGSDIPRCSSVPVNMNSFHNDMGPHNGEGVLGDDDSIYMSLGEIPISFLTAWEQQTQEFGKPF